MSLVFGLVAADAGDLWVHSRCTQLEITSNGPFAVMPDGTLLTVTSEGLRASADDGKTWSAAQPICPGLKGSEPSAYRLVRTRDGTLVLVFLDFTQFKFSWDDERGEPRDDCRLEVWAIRSTDGGKTWTDKQRLLDGYNANFFGFIETSSGRLVVTLEHLMRDPGRWVACSFWSDDAGQSWQRSNFIDLGGHGHHDGATEPTVAELRDGQLLMFIRTNLDRFWQAVSTDGGRYWRIIGPSPIDASSSPGQLLRLQSGRLVLVWNRLDPEGRRYPRSRPGPASEVACSWHREELSIAYSDDGRTWSKPVVIARQPGGQLSYPYVFERRPGELWIIAGFAFRKSWKERFSLRLKLNEQDLVRLDGKP
ncbi:MAG: exo-alpha-sialidase [Planctomycetes bacterium]|nr:exo-alpha-sialidase [Planctomycetota bacterium]